MKSLFAHLVQHKEAHVAHGDHAAVDEIRQSSSILCWEIQEKKLWSTRKFIEKLRIFHCKGEKDQMIPIQMLLNKTQGANSGANDV